MSLHFSKLPFSKLPFSKLTIVLAGLLLNGLLPLSTLATEVGFEPAPDNGRPHRTTAGGSRNPGYCPNDQTGSQPLAALQSPDPAVDSALAVQIQVPKTSAREAEFSLFDESGRGVYQTLLALGDESGVIRIDLPETASQPQSSRRYRWVFSLICQADDRLQDRSISGWIQPGEASALQN
ncbi:MAG: DUF928 domain-containing protein [Oculatellaceae cyanobacterium bins.114]|nr:DUF928 domain-containing protein [Oculatellaceae cyanobacterium bins.114]